MPPPPVTQSASARGVLSTGSPRGKILTPIREKLAMNETGASSETAGEWF
jgi:hypothetical protein